jgi:hypothetical protein
VDVNYLSAEFPDRGLYLRPQDYVLLGIPAKIYDWIFSWWAKKYSWRERFPIHEIGRIDGGRGFRTGKNVFRIGRNTFYNQKNKILMKIPEFKRSGIGLIAGFCGIPNGFPNQVHYHCNNRRFHDSTFRQACHNVRQQLTFCGVNAHFQMALPSKPSGTSWKLHGNNYSTRAPAGRRQSTLHCGHMHCKMQPIFTTTY